MSRHVYTILHCAAIRGIVLHTRDACCKYARRRQYEVLFSTQEMLAVKYARRREQFNFFLAVLLKDQLASRRTGIELEFAEDKVDLLWLDSNNSEDSLVRPSCFKRLTWTTKSPLVPLPTEWTLRSPLKRLVQNFTIFFKGKYTELSAGMLQGLKMRH